MNQRTLIFVLRRESENFEYDAHAMKSRGSRGIVPKATINKIIIELKKTQKKYAKQ